MVKIYGILASDPKGVIGKEGHLPWENQEELKHFQKTIGDYPLIMGYKTFIHLPKKYFEGREVIVFTHHLLEAPFIAVPSLEAFLNLKKKGTFYLIGGGEIARLFLEQDLVDEWIITIFKKDYEGDTYFPLEKLSSLSHKKEGETADFTIYRYFKWK